MESACFQPMKKHNFLKNLTGDFKKPVQKTVIYTVRCSFISYCEWWKPQVFITTDSHVHIQPPYASTLRSIVESDIYLVLQNEYFSWIQIVFWTSVILSHRERFNRFKSWNFPRKSISSYCFEHWKTCEIFIYTNSQISRSIDVIAIANSFLKLLM